MSSIPTRSSGATVVGGATIIRSTTTDTTPYTGGEIRGLPRCKRNPRRMHAHQGRCQRKPRGKQGGSDEWKSGRNVLSIYLYSPVLASVFIPAQRVHGRHLRHRHRALHERCRQTREVSKTSSTTSSFPRSVEVLLEVQHHRPPPPPTTTTNHHHRHHQPPTTTTTTIATTTHQHTQLDYRKTTSFTST